MVKTAVVTIITSSEQLSEWFLQKSKKQLIIFDLHQGWSGNCESVMLPTYENLLLDYENSEERFAFASLEIPKFAKDFMKLLNDPSSSGSNKKKQRQKRRYSEVNRLNLKHRGCAPLFVAIRDQVIAAIIEGTNPPSLVKVVSQFIPETSEMDEPIEI